MQRIGSTDNKPPPLTDTLASTLQTLREVGAEISSQDLARQMGLSRSAVYERLCDLERHGLVTSRRVENEENRSARAFRVCEPTESTLKHGWEYDPENRVITTTEADGNRYLVAIRVKPRHARVIFRMIQVATVVAWEVRPKECRCGIGPCNCVACEAQRCLQEIGGGE